MKKRADSHARRRRKARRKRIPDQAFSQPRNADSLFRRVLDHLKQHCVPCEPDETSGRIGVEVHYFPENNTTLRDPDGNAVVRVMITIGEEAGTVDVQAYVPWGVRTVGEQGMVQGLLGISFKGAGLDLTFQDNPSGSVGIRATTREPESVFRRMLGILLAAHELAPLVRHVMQNDFQAAAEAHNTLSLGGGMPDKEWMSRRRTELASRLEAIFAQKLFELDALTRQITQRHNEAVRQSNRYAGDRDVFYYPPFALVVLVDRTIVGHEMTFSERRTTDMLVDLDNKLATSCRDRITRVRVKKFFSDDNAESGDG